MSVDIVDPTPLKSVAEFHDRFDLPITPEPVIPPAKRCELRISLIQEELNELKEAIENDDLIEVADAYCDLQYVLSGAILEFGIGHRFSALFKEVHRSNMSKACKTEEEAKQTVDHYKQTKNTEAYYLAKGDVFLVYRKSDDKVLKSINYSAADIEKYLNG